MKTFPLGSAPWFGLKSHRISFSMSHTLLNTFKGALTFSLEKHSRLASELEIWNSARVVDGLGGAGWGLQAWPHSGEISVHHCGLTCSSSLPRPAGCGQVVFQCLFPQWSQRGSCTEIHFLWITHALWPDQPFQGQCPILKNAHICLSLHDLGAKTKRIHLISTRNCAGWLGTHRLLCYCCERLCDRLSFLPCLLGLIGWGVAAATQFDPSHPRGTTRGLS